MAATANPVGRLQHIKAELDWMLAEFNDVDYDTFASSVLSIRAVERGLLIISEAAKSLPDDVIAQRPEIDWPAVRAIGNVLRHDYQRIEPRRLWLTVAQDLPMLMIAIEGLLDTHAPRKS